MSPQRIQLRRTKGWRKPDGPVSVARPTEWGNPFTILDLARPLVVVDMNGRICWTGHEVYSSRPAAMAAGRPAAVNLYRSWIAEQPEIRRRVRLHLAGKNSACWCPLDQPCHANVLLEIANNPDERRSA